MSSFSLIVMCINHSPTVIPGDSIAMDESGSNESGKSTKKEHVSNM